MSGPEALLSLPRLLDRSPLLLQKIINYENVLPHTPEEWENKIDPVLFELGKREDTVQVRFKVDGEEVLFTGNDPDFADFVERGRKRDPSTALGMVSRSNHPSIKPGLFLYVFSGLTDLAILRRLKEYPDETDRAEIEAYWLAECAEARSIIVINREKNA